MLEFMISIIHPEKGTKQIYKKDQLYGILRKEGVYPIEVNSNQRFDKYALNICSDYGLSLPEGTIISTNMQIIVITDGLLRSVQEMIIEESTRYCY